jgi:indole-3-glycerol phosphate synthase
MQNKKNFLKEIIQIKKLELIQKTRKTSVSINQRNQYFLDAIRNGEKIKLIAEVKFASPVNPHLGSPDELILRAKKYEQSGADAISLITEKHFFKGDVSFVSQVKTYVAIPVLQKDFVIDPLQIYEAKEIGSDALLLIARLVDQKTLQRFINLCFDLGIEPVVEVSNEEDLKKAIGTKTNIIAVNARDLETFVIDITKACLLMRKIPNQFIKLGFSGINSAKEVLQYKNAGAKGVLAGTSLMRSKDIAGFINGIKI